MFLNLDRWSLPTFALRQVLLRWNKLSRNWTAATFKRGGDGSDIRPFAGHCKFCHSKATSRNLSPSSGMLVCCFLQAENGAAKVSNKGDRFVSTTGSWVRKKNVPSEAAWLRKRKQSLQAAVRDANPSAGSAPVENHDLPEKKQEACQRLAKASMKRRVEADEDGYLLPSEVPPKKKDKSTGKKWRKTIRNGKNKHPRLLFMMKWSPSKWTFLVSKGASLDLCFGFRHPQSMKNKQPSILGPTASN